MEENLGYLTSGYALLMATSIDNKLLNTISFILSILASIFTIAFNLYRWYLKAKKDNTLTSEEIEEGFEILQEGIENLDDTITKGKGE